MHSLKGLKFIFHYLKRYWISLLIVSLFIGITTYFQIKAPEYMGNSIDGLVTYVSSENQIQVYKSIEEGTGIPKDTKDNLENSISSIKDDDMTTDQKNIQNLLNMSNEKLQTYFLNNKELIKILELDSNYNKDIVTNKDKINNIKNMDISDQEKRALLSPISKTEIYSKGSWNQVQIDAIKSSDVLSDQYKKTLIFAPPDKLKPILNSVNYNLITDASSKDDYDSFISLLVNFILSIFLLSISNYIYMRFMVKSSAKTSRDIRYTLFDKIEKLSIRFFDKTPDGDLLSRFINDIDNVSNAMNQSFTQALAQIVLLITVIRTMFIKDNTTYNLVINNNTITINNLLTLSTILFAIIAIIIAIFLVKAAQRNISVQQDNLGTLNAYIDEKINQQKTIIAYGLEEESINSLKPYNDEFKNKSTKGQLYAGLLMPVITGFGAINLSMLVFIGSILILNGSTIISIGLLITFINYSQRFFQPLAQVFSQYNLIELGLTGANRIRGILEEKTEVVNSKNAVDIDGINGLVSLKNVNFSYDKGKEILKNINIDVKKGQMVALVGPTGSGKTTVMNLMNRFYDIDSGEILFDGREIKDITLETLRKNVGIVLQESVLFTGTIAENLSYGKDNATKDEIISAAKKANIHDYIMSLDDGYETMLSNNSSIFSTGQKQLLSIARTIITDPDLLILDEATSNVDTYTEAKIQVAINNILKDRTSFVIAHRLKTILDADIIVVLKNGEIIEKGNHFELLKKDGFYAELYHNQFVK